MMRFRDRKSGKTVEIQDQLRFLEICDNDGLIAMLVYADESGAVKLIRAGDPEARRYSQIFEDAKFCDVLPVSAPK